MSTEESRSESQGAGAKNATVAEIRITVPQGSAVSEETRQALDRVVAALNRYDEGPINDIRCAKIHNEPCNWYYDCVIVGS